MLQFFAGLTYEIVRLFAALTGLGAIGYCLVGLVDQALFERGLLLGLIAIILALVARSLRRFEL